MFAAQVERLRALFSIEPGEVSVPTFPLFGLFDVALGQTIVVPRMDATRPADADPAEIVGRIERHGAAQLFGSPALLDAVGRWGEERGVKLSSLKRVLSAGAPVSWKIAKRFAKLLPEGCQFFTPYGATEALPVAVISAKEILNETAGASAQGKGTCVGRPVDGAEVRVIKTSDEPIPCWTEDLVVKDGEIGEIAVSGPMVSPRYWQRPSETASAKIARGEGFYHRMGDLGYIDVRGRLWFCGRKSQRVIVRGRLLPTVSCEGVFNAHPRVRRSALVGVDAIGERIPVLCVELEREARGEEERVRGELLALAEANELTRGIHTILFHPKFPVDIRHNAKIFREKLAEWAAARVRR
jgi:acyl-CoA synthetase (AMP-forming)/AMP-acid ligase II